MKTKKYRKLVSDLDELNIYQQRIIRENLDEIALKKEVSQHLETPRGEVKCAYCKSSKVQRWGKRNDMQRYRCKECKKTFNSLTGTPLARLRRKGHWLDYSNCIVESYSIRKSAEVCKISIRTAFRWRHRFLANAKQIKASELCGIIETDEIYFDWSYKGSKKGYFDKETNAIERKKICLFVGRDRNRNTFDNLFTSFTSSTLGESFNKVLSSDILLCFDNKTIYKTFAKDNKLRHGFVDSKNGPIIKKDIIHIKNINNYYFGLLNWMVRFRGVATKYLENYISWYREFDEQGDALTAKTILSRAKSGDSSCYLPLKAI